MGIFYVDGQFVDEDKAVLSVNDMAVLRGYGIFDFMRTYNKKPFYLKAHIDRLYRSADHVGLQVSCTREKLFGIVMETLARNDYEESNVRIVFTGGISPDSVTPAHNGKLMVMVTPMHNFPDRWYERGVKIITSRVERYIPEAKSTNYMNAVLTLQDAKKAGAVESVYVDRQGRVLEGTTTNIFLLIEDRWVTSDRGILKGITRAVVIDLMNEEIELRDLDQGDIDRSEEILITASNKEVVPVIQVDHRIIGTGKPGEKTRRIMELFKEYTAAYGLDTRAASA